MQELINKAKKVIDQHIGEVHKVAAVMQAKDGRIFQSVSVQGQKLHLCSEWSALTQALMAKADIIKIVAVRKKNDQYIVYPPCGLCRELFLTYYPDAKVAISETESVKALELLPSAYTK